REPDDVRRPQQGSPLVLGEPSLRADQNRERRRSAAGGPGRGERRQRVPYLGLLIAEDQQALRLSLGQHALEAEWGSDLRQRQDAALLGSLDRIGLHALKVDARDLG